MLSSYFENLTAIFGIKVLMQDWILSHCLWHNTEQTKLL